MAPSARLLAAAVLAACVPVRAGTAAPEPSSVEVQIVSPRPGAALPGGATVPLRARLAGDARAASAAGWALSIALDDDGESTVVPGGVVNGELPALPPGPHSITISLVDGGPSGALLGPRARVHFTVGVAPPPPDIVIDAPGARLARRAPADGATAASVRITQLQALEGTGWDGRVAINGIDITSAGRWQLAPAAPGSSGGGGLEWRSHLANLPDGLHMLDAELTDPSGAVFARDRRYFELLTSNASHPRGGIEYAADGENCCEALEGGRDFVAPPVPEATMHSAFSDAHAHFEAREALDVLNEWCQIHSEILNADDTGVRSKRFLVMPWTCQKRPTTVSKETYYSVKRDLLQCQRFLVMP